MKTASQADKEQRFRVIYTETFDKLNRIFLRSLKSEELTHDVLQEAYLKLWARLGDLDACGDYMPFLYFHARNHARKEINSRLKRELLEQELKRIDEVADMDTDLDKKEYRYLLCKAVDGLPPKRRQVYRMFKEDGMSYKRIAETLNISDKTVDNHLNEATKAIKRRIHSIYDTGNLFSVLLALFYSVCL